VLRRIFGLDSEEATGGQKKYIMRSMIVVPFTKYN
jgi:hypothetical protein